MLKHRKISPQNGTNNSFTCSFIIAMHCVPVVIWSEVGHLSDI